MRRIPAVLCAVLLFSSLAGCASLEQASLIRQYTAESVQSTPVPEETAACDPGAAPLTSPVTDPFLGLDITFLALGDNLIHPNIYMDAEKRGTAEKKYDFLPVYTDIADAVAAADFAFINQETVMAGESYGYSGYPQFNTPQQLGRDLVTLGFDIINIANNHMLDMGTQGLVDTVAFWETQPVTLLGADRPPAEPVMLEKDGVRIAMLSYTYSTNGMVQRSDAAVKAPYIDRDRILADMETVKNRQADVILVSMHWGIENTHTPSDEQRELAQMLADAGADVIIGHHSHCLQPIEWLTGAEGQETLCIYSLGNCISGMAAPLNQVGGMFTFSIVSDGTGGVRIADPLFLPTVFYYGPGWFNTRLYLLEDYTEEIAATHGVQMSGYTLSPEKARQIVTDVMDPQFLPEWLRTTE